jgi:hypothetical protein
VNDGLRKTDALAVALRKLAELLVADVGDRTTLADVVDPLF